MNNKQRITLLSFLAYFVMSGVLAPMGILSGPMAEHFGQPVTKITASFSWLTFGNLTGALLALFIFNWRPLKQTMALTYLTIVICLVSLTVVQELTAIGFSLGIVGICCGVGLAGAALTISRSYERAQRASMLIITDGSFSVAGIVTSWLAVFFVAREYHWPATYQFVAFIAAIVVVLTLTSNLPSANPTRTEAGKNSSQWPASIWLCIAALFLYTFGQWCILLWLPNYAETVLGASREQAGTLIGQFWTGMFAAQIFVAWWVLKIGVRRLVVFAATTTTLFSTPLWLYDDVSGLVILATVWGFANLSLLKVTLSFATEMVNVPSARLISALLLGATVGTAVSPYITSQIVEMTSSKFVMQLGSASYATMALLLLFVSRSYSQRTSEIDTS